MHALRLEALASTLSQTKVIAINGVNIFILVWSPHNTELSSSISEITSKCASNQIQSANHLRSPLTYRDICPLPYV